MNKLTEPQKAFVRQMVDALEPFFRIRTAMPARCIQAFLYVCQDEDKSVVEYAKRAGMSPTTMGRNLLDLGDRDRKGEEGAGLVEGFDNLLNRREKSYRLTPKGRALLATITRRAK